MKILLKKSFRRCLARGLTRFQLRSPSACSKEAPCWKPGEKPSGTQRASTSAILGFEPSELWEMIFCSSWSHRFSYILLKQHKWLRQSVLSFWTFVPVIDRFTLWFLLLCFHFFPLKRLWSFGCILHNIKNFPYTFISLYFPQPRCSKKFFLAY